MDKYFVYILKSKNYNKHYIGQTKDLIKRLEFHNSSQARWTRRYQPWELVYKEEYETRTEVMNRELELKKQKDIKKFLEIKAVR